MAFPVERARTALIAGLLFLAMILSHRWSYIILWCIILGVSLFELYRMLKDSHPRPSLLIFGIFPTLLALAHFEFGQQYLDKSYVLALLCLEIALLIVLTIDFLFFPKSKLLVRLPSFLSMLYIGNAVALLLIMRSNLDNGALIVLYLLMMVWAADVGAYFSGKRFGKNKLIPSVSPNKTWEGLIGGLFSTLVIAIIIHSFTGLWQLIDWLILAVIITVGGVIGDLVESRLKRLTGHKDSGSILPGHGGMLDRFDAAFGFIPFVFLYLYWQQIITL